jgi:hypothetical protein
MKKTKIILASIGFIVLSMNADEFSSWEWLVPKPAGIFLSEVAFDGTRFIGVGDMGVVLTSTNGTDWNLAYNDITNRLYGIALGGPRILTYGQRVTMLASDDASVWSKVELPSTNAIWSAVYGMDRYVLFTTGENFISVDGLHWEKPQVQSEQVFTDLVFGAGTFVGISGGFIGTSTNGVDWVARESGTEGVLWSIAYGDGVFVAVGEEGSQGIILTSTDGISWLLQTTNFPLKDVAFGEFGFVVTGGGFLGAGESVASPDGIYFSGGEPGAAGLDSVPNGLACGNGICVAVGGQGRIWVTEDGTNWVAQSSGTHATVHSFASDGLRVVAVEDGQAFADRTVSVGEHFMAATHTGSRFVAVGSKSLIRTSTDGQHWEWEWTGADADYKAVAHGNGNTVILGWNSTGKPYGQFTVRDAHGVWRVVRPAEASFLSTSLAFGAGRFVAAGYYGEIWTSLDGLEWERLNLGTGQTILPIQFINGRFIGIISEAVGFSDDGLNWTFTPGNPPPIRHLAHGNGVYVAAGSTWGGIQVSPDAINWTMRPMKTLSLSSAVYFKDSFYVAGYVLKSVSSLVPEITQFGRSGGELNFHLFGRIGREYELQSSPNLTDWKHEQDYTQSARQHPLTLPTGPDQRFYRVKLKE